MYSCLYKAVKQREKDQSKQSETKLILGRKGFTKLSTFKKQFSPLQELYGEGTNDISSFFIGDGRDSRKRVLGSVGVGCRRSCYVVVWLQRDVRPSSSGNRWQAQGLDLRLHSLPSQHSRRDPSLSLSLTLLMYAPSLSIKYLLCGTIGADVAGPHSEI